MQQTRSYWRVVAVASVLGMAVATACTVTTSTDDSAGGTGTIAGSTSSTAGQTSTAGSGGASTGGSAGSTSSAGTSSTAGSGTGGSSGLTSFQCDPATGNSDVGTPSSCEPTTTNGCSTCISSKCCTEYGKCYATGPGNQCGYGGPKGDGMGEFNCIQACVIAATADGGVADAETLGTCSAGCVTPKDTSGASCMQHIGEQTNDLITCVNTNCQADCFGG